MQKATITSNKFNIGCESCTYEAGVLPNADGIKVPATVTWGKRGSPEYIGNVNPQHPHLHVDSKAPALTVFPRYGNVIYLQEFATNEANTYTNPLVANAHTGLKPKDGETYSSLAIMNQDQPIIKFPDLVLNSSHWKSSKTKYISVYDFRNTRVKKIADPVLELDYGKINMTFKPGNGPLGQITSDISTGSYFIFKHETTTPNVTNRSFKYGGVWDPNRAKSNAKHSRHDISAMSTYNLIFKRQGDELWAALYYNSLYRNLHGVTMKSDDGSWSHDSANAPTSPEHCIRGSKKHGFSAEPGKEFHWAQRAEDTKGSKSAWKYGHIFPEIPDEYTVGMPFWNSGSMESVSLGHWLSRLYPYHDFFTANGIRGADGTTTVLKYMGPDYLNKRENRTGWHGKDNYRFPFTWFMPSYLLDSEFMYLGKISETTITISTQSQCIWNDDRDEVQRTLGQSTDPEWNSPARHILGARAITGDCDYTWT
jgi:hypothetical protein